MALCFENIAKYVDALVLFRRCYEGFRTVYGQDHQETMDAMNQIQRQHILDST